MKAMLHTTVVYYIILWGITQFLFYHWVSDMQYEFLQVIDFGTL